MKATDHRTFAGLSERLMAVARTHPDKPALCLPTGKTVSYGDFSRRVLALADGLRKRGVTSGVRVLVLFRPGVDFAALIFALDRLYAVPVLLDPNIGIRRMLSCIRQAALTAMVTVPAIFVLRALVPGPFSQIKLSMSATRFLRCTCIEDCYGDADAEAQRSGDAEGQDDLAGALVFTSGSTGPPKGVVLTRGQTVARVRSWNHTLRLRDDDVDLIAFPLFLPITLASGRTAVLPEMDFSRPAKVNPERIQEAVERWRPTVCFGSPAFWKVMIQQERTLPTLRIILTGGAPMATTILHGLRRMAPEAEVHNAYGATEALPLSHLHGQELYDEMEHSMAQGAGVCVGRVAAEVELRICRPLTDPESPPSAQAPAVGEIGEVTARSPVVAEGYYGRPQATAEAYVKDADGSTWYRTGDCGYVDDQGRLWLCGRHSHVAYDDQTPYYPLQVEGIFRAIDGVERCALVSVEEGRLRRLALVVEPARNAAWQAIAGAVRERSGRHRLPLRFLYRYPNSFPVDRRHNAKIERLRLARWAQRAVWRRRIL